MPLTPKQRRDLQLRRRGIDPTTKKRPRKVTLSELSEAFGGGAALRKTAAAVKQISVLRGISGADAAEVLRGTRTQIQQGRRRLTLLSQRGAVLPSVARSALGSAQQRVGKQSLPTAGGSLPKGIIDFVIEGANRGQILRVGRRTPDQILRSRR